MPRLRRTVLVLAAVAVVVVIDAAWLAPASLLDSRLARITNGMVRIADAGGTIWHARGVVVAGTARIPIAWRIEPWPLLFGEARLHATPGSGAVAGSPRADVTIGRNSISLRDLDLTIPASVIATATGRIAAEVVAGAVNVKSASLDWKPPASRGEAQIFWRGAGLAFISGTVPLNLGDLQMNLTADGNQLSGPVSNDGGDLDIRGNATIREVDGVRLLLTLAPRRSDNTQLTLALAAIGAADGTGWRVDWRLPLQ